MTVANTLGFYDKSATTTVKSYRFVMYGFRSKLVRLSKQMKMHSLKEALASYKICPFSVIYKSVKSYNTNPLSYHLSWGLYYKTLWINHLKIT
jgi:hypothetical protein